MNTLTTGKLETIWASYKIPVKFVNCRFNNYHPRQKEQHEALKRCREYIEAESVADSKGLFLHGPVGTGKTHLAVATAYAVVEKHLPHFGYKSGSSEYLLPDEINQYRGSVVGFINVTDLLTTLQESYSGNERAQAKAEDMLHRAKMDYLLILDDLGAMKPSEWVETQLYNIIDIRYRMQRPMLITSNCKIKEIEQQVGKRIVSRLFEVTDGIYVPGDDYRKRKLD